MKESLIRYLCKCWLCFQNYLQNAFDNLIKKIKDNIRLNLLINIDLKNEQNPKEILKILDSFF